MSKRYNFLGGYDCRFQDVVLPRPQNTCERLFDARVQETRDIYKPSHGMLHKYKAITIIKILMQVL